MTLGSLGLAGFRPAYVVTPFKMKRHVRRVSIVFHHHLANFADTYITIGISYPVFFRTPGVQSASTPMICL